MIITDNAYRLFVKEDFIHYIKLFILLFYISFAISCSKGGSLDSPDKSGESKMGSIYLTKIGKVGIDCKQMSEVIKERFNIEVSIIDTFSDVEFAYDKEGIVHITVDQKGHTNRKEVSLNVRSKEIFQKEEQKTAQKPVNYILEKAIRLLGDENLPLDLQRELSDLSHTYESALKEDEDDDRIDEIEEDLLEKMEEVEERLEELG